MAQRRVLVLYAVPDSDYARTFITALQQREPDDQFDALNDTEASAFDSGRLEQYDRLIAFLSPELAYTPVTRGLLAHYIALWPGGQHKMIAVILRPTARIPQLDLPPPYIGVGISSEQLADIFARLHFLDFPPNAGRPDPDTPWEDESVGGILPPSKLPPPPPPPAPAPEEQEEPGGWVSRGDDAAPPPYPQQPPAPAPYVPPPAYPPAAPPPVVGSAPPPAPAGAPSPEPPSVVGGAPSERARGRSVDTLRFSAYHPNEAPVEAPQTLLVYTHLLAQLSQIQQDAGTFTELGSAPVVAQGQSLREVPRNIEITVEPHMEGVTFSPAQDSFIWRGEWHRSLFRYSGARTLADTAQNGWIDIYADRISPIGRLDISFSFHTGIPATSLTVPHGMTVTANTFDTVFISYSHRDREAMSQARETYQKLGVTTYHDDLLAAGDNFDQRLAEMIRAANVFHLLWSEASAQSPEVRKEWLLALNRQSSEKFIRPWYWQQPIVTPPKEFQARKISFRYEHLRRKLLRPSTWF